MWGTLNASVAVPPRMAVQTCKGRSVSREPGLLGFALAFELVFGSDCGPHLKNGPE